MVAATHIQQMAALMKKMDLYLWIAAYMLLSVPFNLFRHTYDLEITEMPILYGIMALIKIYLCLYFLEKVKMNNTKKALVLGSSIALRVLFGAPWLALCIGGAIFQASQAKKLS